MIKIAIAMTAAMLFLAGCPPDEDSAVADAGAADAGSPADAGAADAG